MSYFVSFHDHGKKVYLNVNEINFVIESRKGKACIYDNQGNIFYTDETINEFLKKLQIYCEEN